MDFVSSNLPFVAGAIAIGVTTFMYFASANNRAGDSVASSPSSGAKSKSKQAPVPAPPKSSTDNSHDLKPNKKKKSKNKGSAGEGGFVAGSEITTAPAVNSASSVTAPSSSSSLTTAHKSTSASEPPVLASAHMTKAEKKKAKKEEKRRAAAVAAALKVASSSASVTDATTSHKTTVEQPHPAKESADNFQPVESEIPSTDSNDGWSTVEVKGKNKNKHSSSDLSELPAKLEQATTSHIASDSVPSQPSGPIPEAPVVPAPEPIAPPEETVVAEPEKPREPSPPPIPQVEKQVKIDPRKVGFIIGPKGTTLRAIEATAECKIVTPKTDRDSTSLATVTVTGTATAVSRGAKAVTDLATKGYSTLIAGVGFQENSISVPIKSIPDIIGRNGSVIKKIQDIFKVKLNIPDTSNRDASITKIRITVAGMKEQVALAKNVIREITQLFYSSVTHPDTTHVELDVAPETYSLIIGPKGSEIRHIQSNFKVSVHIPSSETTFEKVLIVGTAVAVEKAKAYILKMILKHEQRAQEYEQHYQNHGMDEDEGPHEEWMNQYTYKREVVITPQKSVQPEPSSPFINNVGVVPGPSAEQDSKNSWARIANTNEMIG